MCIRDSPLYVPRHRHDGRSKQSISHGRRDEGEDGVGRRLRRRVGRRWVADGGGLLTFRTCWFRSDGAPVDAGLFRGRRLYPDSLLSLRAGVAHHGAPIYVTRARAASFLTRFDSWRGRYFVIFRTRKISLIFLRLSLM